jgi:hypothetical protein
VTPELEATRIRRLLGLAPDLGARGDLARAERVLVAEGPDANWFGRPVSAAIAGYRETIATYEARLRELESRHERCNGRTA